MATIWSFLSDCLPNLKNPLIPDKSDSTTSDPQGEADRCIAVLFPALNIFVTLKNNIRD